MRFGLMLIAYPVMSILNNNSIYASAIASRLGARLGPKEGDDVWYNPDQTKLIPILQASVGSINNVKYLFHLSCPDARQDALNEDPVRKACGASLAGHKIVWSTFAETNFRRLFYVIGAPSVELTNKESQALEGAHICYDVVKEDGGFDAYWARLSGVRYRQQSVGKWTVVINVELATEVNYYSNVASPLGAIRRRNQRLAADPFVDVPPSSSNVRSQLLADVPSSNSNARSSSSSRDGDERSPKRRRIA